MLLSSYTHECALTQAPVLFAVGDSVLTLYPLTMRMELDLNAHLRFHYLRSQEKLMNGVPDEERNKCVNAVLSVVDSISYLHGEGSEVLSGDVDLQVRLIHHLVRGAVEWPDTRIEEVFFPGKQVTRGSFPLVATMMAAVFKMPPKYPELHIQRKDPKYEATPEERLTSRYRALMDKHHWTMDQLLDLTEYQVSWFVYMLPEEREHYEEMSNIGNREDGPNGNKGPDVPYQPGTIHFNSPEEYEAWRRKQPPKK